jgi:hypothetical protein
MTYAATIKSSTNSSILLFYLWIEDHPYCFFLFHIFQHTFNCYIIARLQLLYYSGYISNILFTYMMCVAHMQATLEASKQQSEQTNSDATRLHEAKGRHDRA